MFAAVALTTAAAANAFVEAVEVGAVAAVACAAVAETRAV